MHRHVLSVLALVCAVAAIVLGGGTAGARTAQPQLDHPRIEGSSVVLTGTAPARGAVRLEQRSGGNWQAAAETSADRRGRFSFTRPLPAVTTAYRVVSKGLTSNLRELQVAPAPEPTTDACGVRPSKRSGGLWSCTLSDGFDGTELDRTYWTPLTQPGDVHVGACNVDDPRTVQVAQGTLRLTVRPVTDGLVCPADAEGRRAAYASGSVSTYYKWSQQYGRFETRMKVAAADQPGLQEAFWLWPDVRYADTSTWPASGEIDIVETYSHYADLAIPFLHYNADDNGGPVPGLNTAWDCVTTRGEWHTYTLEWTANRIEIFVDGRSCLVNTSFGTSFDKPFIVSLTRMLGVADNRYTASPTSPQLPATMEVDYVKVWK